MTDDRICSWCGLTYSECDATRVRDYEEWRVRAYQHLGIEKGYDAPDSVLALMSLVGEDPSRCFSIFETLSDEGLIVTVGDCFDKESDFELFLQPYAHGRLMELRRHYGFPSACD